MVDGRKWVIGAGHPTKRRGSPALDMRHGRAAFALLSFRNRLKNGRDIHFSMNEFCHRYAASQGGRYARDILNILFDLQETWVRRELNNGDVEQFTIIGEIKIHQKAVKRKDVHLAVQGQHELWLDRVSLSPEFFHLLERWETLARMRLDVLTSISSPLAQAIYTYIPSRAVHHTKDNPFSITLTNVLEQIGATVPKYKSRRYEKFTKNNNSIISQLDSLEIMGGVLRVGIQETRDKSDYKLIIWSEKSDMPKLPDKLRKSAILQAWLESGRSKTEFDRRAKKAKELSSYHEELLNKAGVEIKGNERFFNLACALLGEGMFQDVLAQAKTDAVEGDPGNSPTKRIIYRLMHTIKQS